MGASFQDFESAVRSSKESHKENMGEARTIGDRVRVIKALAEIDDIGSEQGAVASTDRGVWAYKKADLYVVRILNDELIALMAYSPKDPGRADLAGFLMAAAPELYDACLGALSLLKQMGDLQHGDAEKYKGEISRVTSVLSEAAEKAIEGEEPQEPDSAAP